MVYFLYLILNFSPSALWLFFLVPSHCSHSPYCFKWGGFSMKSSQQRVLTSSPLIFYTLLHHPFFPPLPVSSLFKASVCLIFFFTLCCIFHFLISLSLLVSQTQIKPSLQFSGSSHLASNDPLASLSCLLHSTLIALSLLSTWEKLTPLSYPH